MLSDPSDNVLDGGTTQTYREYVEDGMVMVCLRPKNDDVPSCEELKKALIEPKWTLHLGRKCCVPTLPFNPRLIEADTFEGAFDAVELSEVEKDRAFDQFQLYCWEGSKDEFNGVPTTEVRQDRAKTESYGISTGPYRYGRREEHRILRQKEMQ